MRVYYDKDADLSIVQSKSVAIIGYGSPNKAGSHDCHGAPLGDDEIALTRKELGWDHQPFHVPDNIYAAWDAKDKGAAAEADWSEKFAAYKAAHPDALATFRSLLNARS